MNPLLPIIDLVKIGNNINEPIITAKGFIVTIITGNNDVITDVIIRNNGVITDVVTSNNDYVIT